MDKLKELEDEIRKTTLELSYKGNTYQLPVMTSGIHLDKKNMIQEALNAGRQGTLWERWSAQRHIEKEGFEIPVKICIDKEAFSQSIEAITSDIERKPRNAAIEINNKNEIEIISSREGLKVDQGQLYKNIIDILEKGDTKQINLKLMKIEPEISTNEIKKMEINELLGVYRTVFNNNNKARAYNIRVAASTLNGLLIPPNKIVSFNEIVGPRDSTTGYKDAGVIVNNELIQGPGGGVCQVSTTLYNSVLLSGLEIIERSNHSIPVNYVPIGRDATVVYNNIDFKFRNNTEKYIYIRTVVSEGTLTIKIFGNKDYKRNVSIQTWVTETSEPKVIYKKDSNLYKGQEIVKQEGAKGYLAEGIRIIYNNDVLEKTESLPKSKYNPVNRVIYIGD
ncbi:VanW family protein [Desulfolucanica intricata]|uniref:VanW family protein n=1 Tax=Desulfolucanica intricata TaxID=1285191 RepID=UPI0013520DAF|nr:VanW family protein [Desulfolucanica intricata]